MAARMAGVGRVTVSLRRSIRAVDCRVVVSGEGRVLVDTVSSTLIAIGALAPLLQESGQRLRWKREDHAGLAALPPAHQRAGPGGIGRERLGETSPPDRSRTRRPDRAK